MNTKKATKRALLTSVMALVMCVVMLVGTTFAWFTDTASTAVNKIQAGNLDVDIIGEDNVSLDGKTLSFKDVNNSTNILWEPGATFFTQGFKIVNKGNLALKYKVIVSGVKGDTGLLKAIDFAVVTNNTVKDAAAALTEAGDLLPNGASAPADANTYYYLRGHMKEEAGNEYKGMTLDGISITVVATQHTHENDSFNNQYDAKADEGTEFYTLDKFNELTEIPEGTKTIYVDLSGKSLEGGITIGNANIADHYNYTNWNDNAAPAGYNHNTGRTDTRSSDNAVRYLYSTGKPAVDIILTGSVLGANDTGGFNAGTITLQVPDAANVVFNKVTFGAGQMAMGVWSESFQSTVVDHKLAGITFDGCTFNGNWIQNGAIGAGELVIKNSTFNVHENAGYKGNSNPIWIQNLGQCNVTIEGCTINAVRPIKLWESVASGTVTIKNNTFNMNNFADATGDDAYKNVAIMFCGTTDKVKLGNVEITGNTVTGNATGFICFYDNNTQYPSMNDGATFKLSGNTLPDGVKASVLWKTTTEWKPNYVTE